LHVAILPHLLGMFFKSKYASCVEAWSEDSSHDNYFYEIKIWFLISSFSNYL